MEKFDAKRFLEDYGYGKGPKYMKMMKESEFPHVQGAIYLDHTGAALYPRTLIETHANDLVHNLYGNPHSLSNSSSLSTDLIENIRQRVARHFRTTLEEYDVIFTSGATGSLNLIADSFKWSSSSKFYFLNDNHTSVIGMREVACSKGAASRCIVEGDIVSAMHWYDKNMHRQDHALERSTNMEIRNCQNNVILGKEITCSLFAYPAMSNFCGRKYSLQWAELVQHGLLDILTIDDSASDLSNSTVNVEREHGGMSWYVLLDSASFASSSPLDLTKCQADFVCISFYKIFGFPTGLGALLVRKRAKPVLCQKKYYGGGTVLATLTPIHFHAKKKDLASSFEDGTAAFLSIIALKQGFDSLEKLSINMELVAKHTFALAQYTYGRMVSLKYYNGEPLCIIYKDTDYESVTVQGPIINFNLLRADGAFYGYSEVEKLASLKNIHLRTGCFCNTGDCQKHLGLTVEEMMKNYEAGHVCGDTMDLIDAKPTGSVRISFGYMSTLDDANTFLQFLVECFLLRATSSTNRVKSEPFAHFHFPPILTTEKAIQQFEDMPSCDELTHDLGNMELIGISAGQTDTQNRKTSLGIDIKSIVDKSYGNVKLGTENNKSADTSPYYDYTPALTTAEITLKRICLYPVKSCAAFEVTQWEIGPSGLIYDRCWMIVTDAGVSLTQKREPKLCMIKPEIDLVKQILVLHFEGYESVSVSLIPEMQLSECGEKEKGTETVSTKVCPTRVCGDRISCYDCGDVVADWLTDVLQQPCRLLRQISSQDRKMKSKNADGLQNCSLSLSNVSQFLLVSYKSVHRLHEEIYEDAGGFISEDEIASFADQFRANLIIDTLSAFEEDNWESVKIGNIHFKVTGKSVRCQMICINQATGARSPYPLRALSKLRGTKMEFGIYLAVSGETNGSIIGTSDIVKPSLMQSDKI